MQFYQHVGIAIATAISSWVNCILLFYVLLESKEVVFDKLIKENFKKILIVNIFFGIFVYYFKDFINIYSNYKFLNLSIFVVLNISFYVLLLILFKIFIFSNFRLFKLR